MTPVDDLAAHLTPTHSDRGFARLPAIPGAYGGEATAYESSTASGPHLWLRIQIPANSLDGSMDEDATLHLTADNAVKLAEQLQYLVANHYQGEQRPDDDPPPEIVCHGRDCGGYPHG